MTNAPDPMWEIVRGAWYVWPDLAAGEPITNPTAKFGFSTSHRFGSVGEAFVAQLATGAPVTGRSPGMFGFKVVRVNLKTRQVNDLPVINRPGPGGPGPTRPVDAKFDPS